MSYPSFDYTFAEYARRSNETKVFNLHTDQPIDYCLISAVGELGEICNKYKKVLRGDYPLEQVKTDLQNELGDVLWYLNQLAEYLGTDLETIAKMNIDKLAERKVNETVQGSGDVR